MLIRRLALLPRLNGKEGLGTTLASLVALLQWFVPTHHSQWKTLMLIRPHNLLCGGGDPQVYQHPPLSCFWI